MKTVRLLPFVSRYSAKLTPVSSYSTWLFIRSSSLSFPFGSHTNFTQGLSIISAHRKRPSATARCMLIEAVRPPPDKSNATFAWLADTSIAHLLVRALQPPRPVPIPPSRTDQSRFREPFRGGFIRFLHQGMASVHHCSEVYQSSLPLPEPTLGQAGNRRGEEEHLRCLHSTPGQVERRLFQEGTRKSGGCSSEPG